MSYESQKRQEIMEAYIFLREKNQSIPSDTLELMKDAALERLVNKNESISPVSDLFVLINEIDGDEYYWNGKEWADSKEGCPSYEYKKAVEYSGVFGCRFTDA